MRHRPRVLLVVVLLAFASAGSGCLFPPVEEAAGDSGDGGDDGGDGSGGDGGEGTEPGGGTGPPPTTRYETQYDGQETDGSFSAAVGASTSETEPFDLPPRLVLLSVTVTWESAQSTSDLDVEVELFDVTTGRSVWDDVDNGGDVGDPDDPITITVADEDRIHRTGPTRLDVTITPKTAAVQTDYHVSVNYGHLVPA